MPMVTFYSSSTRQPAAGANGGRRVSSRPGVLFLCVSAALALGHMTGCVGGGGAAVQVDPYASLPPEERIAGYQELLEGSPEDAALHFRLGNAYYDLHQLSRAADEYRRSLELDPELAAAHANLGSVLEESDDYAGALAEYLKAVELAPEDARAHANLGSLYYAMAQDEVAQGREELYDKASDQYREALRRDPDNLEAHYNLGVAFADARLYREALREWQRVMELDPGGPVGNKALSNINLIRSLRLREAAGQSAE